MAQVQEATAVRWTYKVEVPERSVHRHRATELQSFLDDMGDQGLELVGFEWEMTTDKLLYGVFRKPSRA